MKRQLRVVRVLVLEGPEDWVNQTLEKSWVAPDREATVPIGGRLREVVRTREVIGVVGAEETT